MTFFEDLEKYKFNIEKFDDKDHNEVNKLLKYLNKEEISGWNIYLVLFSKNYIFWKTAKEINTSSTYLKVKIKSKIVPFYL